MGRAGLGYGDGPPAFTALALRILLIGARAPESLQLAFRRRGGLIRERDGRGRVADFTAPAAGSMDGGAGDGRLGSTGGALVERVETGGSTGGPATGRAALFMGVR